jgi:hypothetical protein
LTSELSSQLATFTEALYLYLESLYSQQKVSLLNIYLNQLHEGSSVKLKDKNNDEDDKLNMIEEIEMGPETSRVTHLVEDLVQG